MSNHRGPLAVGEIVHGRVVAHNIWGIELALEEVDAYGTVDFRFLSDDPADMNECRFPPLGKKTDREGAWNDAERTAEDNDSSLRSGRS
jgi:hypothetical protein